jgi:hypothetical protein
MLRREAACLRAEVVSLKNMVLQHADCDCPYIQAYIKIAASKLSAGDVTILITTC